MKKLFRKTLGCVFAFAACAALLLPISAHADKKGMLLIVTEPGDAKITINGKQKGNSPSEAGQKLAIKLDEGEYTVEAFKLDGLKEYFGEKKVFVADDVMQTVTLKLQDRPSEAGKKVIAEKEAAKRAEVEKEKAAKKAIEDYKRVEMEKEAAAKKASQDYVPNPEMVAVKAGKFRMGCQGNDKCKDDEKPVLDMNVAAFEIGKYEVTFELWDACYAQGGCKREHGRGKRPVNYVSWDDIQEFLSWINKKTGKTFRLPTEPEWEYAARAGTATVYSWGDEVGQNKANCDGCGSQWSTSQSAPVGSFAANPWAIHDMHGNVWEWVSGCKWAYKDSTADTDASKWKDSKTGKCESGDRVIRGGSSDSRPGKIRAAIRSDLWRGDRAADIGFRLARTN